MQVVDWHYVYMRADLKQFESVIEHFIQKSIPVFDSSGLEAEFIGSHVPRRCVSLCLQKFVNLSSFSPLNKKIKKYQVLLGYTYSFWGN